MITFIRICGPLDDHTSANLYSVVVGVVVSGGAIGWAKPPSRAEFSEWLADVVDAVRAGDAVAVLAGAEGGAVTGFGYWRRYDRPTLRVNADLEKVFVGPGDQRRGIGKQLVGLLVESARQAGVETLTLDVRDDNISAIRLYQRLGFLEYGRRPAFLAFGPYRYDQRLFLKRL